MPRRSNPSSVRSTTVGRPPPTEEMVTTTMSGTNAPDSLVQCEGPRRTEDIAGAEERGIPGRSPSKPIGPRSDPPACHHRTAPATVAMPFPAVAVRSTTGRCDRADAAAADQTPDEGGRRRRALGLCPETPLAVAAEERSTKEGRGRRAGRRPGAARRRRARGWEG
jgi:hypothetical protein